METRVVARAGEIESSAAETRTRYRIFIVNHLYGTI
jgi:hypothetical protein